MGVPAREHPNPLPDTPSTVFFKGTITSHAPYLVFDVLSFLSHPQEEPRRAT
jgi:hypothetical protein